MRDAGRRVHEPALREVAGDAAVFADEASSRDGDPARARRARPARRGRARARPRFTWGATAERTLEVYREVLDA